MRQRVTPLLRWSSAPPGRDPWRALRSHFCFPLALTTFGSRTRSRALRPLKDEPPGRAHSKRTLWVESDDFYCDPAGLRQNRRKQPGKERGKSPPSETAPAGSQATPEAEEPYLILGFDTEFKGPGYAVDRADIKAGRAKFEVLSYQFHAKASSGEEWNGICCPDKGARIPLGEFLVFALGVGARDPLVKKLPRLFAPWT